MLSKEQEPIYMCIYIELGLSTSNSTKSLIHVDFLARGSGGCEVRMIVDHLGLVMIGGIV